MKDIKVKQLTENFDTHTGVTTVWFEVQVPGFEWTDHLLALDKKTSDFLRGSKNFFKLTSEQRTEAIRLAQESLR